MRRSKDSLIRFLLIVALLLLPLALHHKSAKGAALDPIKDVISDSGSGDYADHTITFTTPTGVPVSDTITVTFPSGFTMGSLDEDDTDIKDDAAELTTAGDCAGTEDCGVSVSGQEIEFEICTEYTGGIGSTSVVEIQIGLNATSSGTGDGQVQNHSTQGTYTIAVAGTMDDDGDALIAIVDDITASVTVGESLSFAVAGQTDAQCQDVADADSHIDTTATTVPFATPTLENFIDACHELTVSTNAEDGYQVTVVEDDQLGTGTYEIADGNCDGGCGDATAAAWGDNTNNGFGYCMIDVTGGDKDPDFDTYDCAHATPYFKTFPDQNASETPETVMLSSSPVSGSVCDLGYRVSVPGSQDPGSYTNEIIYVCTPTY